MQSGAYCSVTKLLTYLPINLKIKMFGIEY